MEEYVDKILISKGNLEPVFLVKLDHVTGPVGSSHHRQIHQHHTGVQSYRKKTCEESQRQDYGLVIHVYLLTKSQKWKSPATTLRVCWVLLTVSLNNLIIEPFYLRSPVL